MDRLTDGRMVVVFFQGISGRNDWNLRWKRPLARICIYWNRGHDDMYYYLIKWLDGSDRPRDWEF